MASKKQEQPKRIPIPCTVVLKYLGRDEKLLPLNGATLELPDLTNEELIRAVKKARLPNIPAVDDDIDLSDLKPGDTIQITVVDGEG